MNKETAKSKGKKGYYWGALDPKLGPTGVPSDWSRYRSLRVEMLDLQAWDLGTPSHPLKALRLHVCPKP